MIMSGVYSNCVLFACLLACVLGSELVRNKRQWPYAYDIGDNHYGSCGKPTTPIPHGGIKLFPVTDFDNPYDNSCYSCESFGCPFCEPKFYCKEGYEKKGVFHLECVQNTTTLGYEWEGSIPACEEIKSSSLFIYAIPGLAVPGMLMIAVIGAAIRSHRRGDGRTRTAPRTGLRPTTIFTTPSSRGPDGHTFNIPRAPFRGPGYSRFHDSNVNVPRDETITSRYDTEAAAMETVSSDAPPSYTQALQIEGADPASTVITPKTTVDTPAAIIATT